MSGSDTSRSIALKEGLPDYIIRALERAGLERREYQESAYLKALELLRNGENAEINLPPGTGKTLISQMIACSWIKESASSSSKVLCVLPSSILREQHYYNWVWWASDIEMCTPLEVSSEWMRHRGVWHQGQVENRNIWFALPSLFCNAVDAGYIPLGALNRVGLVVIDEYDAFSIAVLRAGGYRLRFSRPAERLSNILDGQDRRYLLLSATPARTRGD